VSHNVADAVNYSVDYAATNSTADTRPDNSADSLAHHMIDGVSHLGAHGCCDVYCMYNAKYF
jgi:hypothetical protein